MASVIDKVLTLLGVRDVEEDKVEKVEPSEPSVVQKQVESKPLRKTNLISLEGGAKPVRIIIIEPTAFEEVRTYVDHLKNRHPIILRLNSLDVQEARRIVDFMSGATYAIDGNMRKLGDMIFFFAPHSVVIEGELDADSFDFSTLDD